MALAIGLWWALKWLLRLPLGWARRQLVRLVQKSFVAALALLMVSIALTVVMHQETRDLSSRSTREPAAPMGCGNSLFQGILRVLQDSLLHFTALLAFQEPLTIANLLRHRDRLQSLGMASYELRACLEQAIEEFSKEPPVVQANARMSIQCAGRALEFLSGRGDCEISVYILHQRIQYKAEVRTGELYLARLAVRPGPLSVDDLLTVRRQLQGWGVLSKELRGCLDFALQEFAEEPLCVQDDARMVMDCAGQALSFVSGSEGNQINIYDNRDGRVHYRIRVSGLWAGAARFLSHNWPHHRGPRREALPWD